MSLCPICENNGRMPNKIFYMEHRNSDWKLCPEHDSRKPLRVDLTNVKHDNRQLAEDLLIFLDNTTDRGGQIDVIEGMLNDAEDERYRGIE